MSDEPMPPILEGVTITPAPKLTMDDFKSGGVMPDTTPVDLDALERAAKRAKDFRFWGCTRNAAAHMCADATPALIAELRSSRATDTLDLDTYERDNLRSALAACSGYYGETPLNAMNNGDWLMQVLHKLGWIGKDRTDMGRPNHTPEQIIAAAASRATDTDKPANGDCQANCTEHETCRTVTDTGKDDRIRELEAENAKLRQFRDITLAEARRRRQRISDDLGVNPITMMGPFDD